MPRYRHYIDKDVLTAARERTRHVFDVFDTVAVMFSGGKDSLTCLYLALEVVEERKLPPIPVVFLDQELISRQVTDFVASFREHPLIDLKWLVFPMESRMLLVDKVRRVVFWDPNRKHMRQPPPYAITLPPGDKRMPRQQEADAVVADLCQWKGRTGHIIGVRAAESLTRYRSVVNKLNENYIVASACPQVKLCKPLYDWQENDIFKFLHDHDAPWCPIYDSELVAGMELRVATALHPQAAKRLDMLPATDPEWYQGLIEIFPEIAAQARLWNEYDREELLKVYEPMGFDGCFRYIMDFIDEPKERSTALRRLKEFRVHSKHSPKAYHPTKLLKAMMAGTITRVILPDSEKQRGKGAM
jgi:predicted phosphoadenosine phosphosulfate sulfurtransferase